MKITNKDLIDPKEVKKYEPNKVTIICTGSQGEELAALSRISTGQNVHIELDTSDTVVFASNPIPGNNYQIGKVIDALHKTKCIIIKNTDFFKTHASGHASQEEQKLLISMWQPKYFMPVHGTYTMLRAHQKTSQLLGIPLKNSYIADNGDILCLDAKKPYIKRKIVPGNSIYISGKNINVSLTDGTMDKLASDGIMLFTAIYDKQRNLISYPQTITRGFIVINKSLDILKKIQKMFLESYHSHKELSIKEQSLAISEDMTLYVSKLMKKKPYISTHLVEYKPKDIKK
jgi:ribonuclease J